ncbi:hypothetical protein ABIE21_003271 [Conyzicola nivalis]|uniref:Uncharacterized protein n=1 Tax=Conyzicola nivalis TaxID=1477021 RepID=A0ABV2QT46_9MICO
MLTQLGLEIADTPLAAPRLSTLSPTHQAEVLDTYRSLGGQLEEPQLRPGAWDLTFTKGLVVELDDELHFNRFRLLTLSAGDRRPWDRRYRQYCEDFEIDCLKAGTWSKRWTTNSAERLMGAGDPVGELGDRGAPRWKQRALYDSMKDLAGDVRLCRLSVSDNLGSVSLGKVLAGRATYKPARLATLVHNRLASN